MNRLNENPDDSRIRSLLSEARPHPELPLRFRDHVWRRIEQGETRSTNVTWLNSLAVLFLKPRFAVASIAVLLLAGTLIGSLNGQAQARLIAQERYVATVAMPTH